MMKKLKTNNKRENGMTKRLDDVYKTINKTKEKCFKFWLEVNSWNSKNDNSLRDFELLFMNKIINEFRAMEGEHPFLKEQLSEKRKSTTRNAGSKE